MSLKISYIARGAQVIWLIASAIVLVGFLMTKGNPETADFLSRFMLGLSFPLGLLALPLIFVTMFAGEMISPLGSLIVWFGDYVIVWFWFFVLGVVQWFLIVPGIVWAAKRFKDSSKA